ncbi:MAG: hypothetical protein K6F64_03970 [Clostridia bacterium]|nr:hypothetical protein [Clostridia bacterium]
MPETKKDKRMLIGVNTFESDIVNDAPVFLRVAGNGDNLDYAVVHFDPNTDTVSGSFETAEKTASKLKELNLRFISNFEFQNFSIDSKGKDGYEWANRKDGTHLLNLPDGYIGKLASKGNYDGLMYDEFEHVIVNRNLSLELASKGKIKKSAFPLLDYSDVLKQGDLLDSQLREYADSIKNQGAPAMCGEHVFPVLFHRFASNGITPNFKSQKESYSNIQFAIAAGAALEYGTELFNCVDLWFRMTNPGHSPNEMYHNLVFAYLSGVSRVYVESCHAFSDASSGQGVLNEYGKTFINFCKSYKGKERDYDISDFRPEIGIIRYDDTFWGQCDPVAWKPMLFGNKLIKPDYRAGEYLKVFNLLSHGETCKNGLSWDRISPWSLRPHRSFASLNSTAVFDDRVGRDVLESLKLCFLCGYHISDETLSAVNSLVKENGLVCVTTKRFAPAAIALKAEGSYSEIESGKGKWIIVKSFEEKKLRNAVLPFIGKKGEMRLTFRNRTVRMKISPNGEAFTVI